MSHHGQANMKRGFNDNNVVLKYNMREDLKDLLLEDF